MTFRLMRVAVLLIAVWLPAAGALADDYWGKPLPAVPTQFLFGYGSLINTPSRNATVGKSTQAIPVRVSAAFGYVRAWIEQAPSGFTALGLRQPRPDERPTTINGVLYPVEEKDLPLFDEREQGYARVAVPASAMEAVSWQQLPKQAQVWVYIPNKEGARPEDRPRAASRDFPIVQSYIDVVVEGALEYGPDFARELIETTTDWNEFWLNDRELARRPWVHDKTARDVDRLLAATAPAAEHFKDRLLPEIFATRFYRAGEKP